MLRSSLRIVSSTFFWYFLCSSDTFTQCNMGEVRRDCTYVNVLRVLSRWHERQLEVFDIIKKSLLKFDLKYKARDSVPENRGVYSILNELPENVGFLSSSCQNCHYSSKKNTL